MAASLCAALICGCGKKEEPSAASAGTPDGTAAETPTQAAATQAAAPQGGMVDPHWFDDAVFVGDSITTTRQVLQSIAAKVLEQPIANSLRIYFDVDPQ